MRFANIRITTGPRLHYAEHGDAGGEAIVFLHGWPDSWFSFSRVVEKIPERYRALLIDQRGFGESERPDGGYDIRSMAADVAGFLDALSIDRATIVGHSFGSFVARRVALDYPKRVDRLVLIGTGWLGSNDVTRDVHASLDGLSDPVSREFARDFQASTVFSPLPEAFFEQIVSESLKLPSRLWAELLGSVISYDDRNDLVRMAVPTLLLWGDHDALFPRDDQERLAAAIPRARLRIYPEIGHCPNWECPDEVAVDLVAFKTE
jgi:pimeloyl-ACP methyl ester carboxylesterase